jgi:hypothetical protein
VALERIPFFRLRSAERGRPPRPASDAGSVPKAEPVRERQARAAPANRPRRALRLFPRARTCAGLAALIGTIGFGFHLLAPGMAESSVEPPAPVRPAWSETQRSEGAYAMPSPLVQGLKEHYRVRRHDAGGGRQDILTFGEAADRSAPFVMVAIYRPGSEAEIPANAGDAVAEFIRLGKWRAGLRDYKTPVQTKFGDLAAMQMRLELAGGDRHCLAAAARFAAANLGLVAWFCSPGQEIVGHGQLACMLDRLQLMSSGRDEKLIAFFARAELNRSFCDVRNPLMGNAPRLPGWISGKDQPQLRGKIGSR